MHEFDFDLNFNSEVAVPAWLFAKGIRACAMLDAIERIVSDDPYAQYGVIRKILGVEDECHEPE
ncbi:hypothetical protein LI291_10520 [Intestinibacillus massiliensis]|nr:hypothetical protein [Intestinibacillus massiliensis]